MAEARRAVDSHISWLKKKQADEQARLDNWAVLVSEGEVA